MIGNGSGNKTVINKFGVNLDIDTGSVPETIWAHGGIFPFLSAGVEINFESFSANDSIGGTGAQKLTITWYDNENLEHIETFDTNGVTGVQLPGLVKLVSRAEVTQSGALNTNLAEINFIDRATGLIVYQSIEAGEGQTLSTPQMVPNGMKGIVKRVFAEYARSGAAFNDADLRFRVRKSNGTILTKLPTVISPNNPSGGKDYGVGGIEMEAGDIAFWECTSVSANDTPILAGFDIEFESIE